MTNNVQALNDQLKQLSLKGTILIHKYDNIMNVLLRTKWLEYVSSWAASKMEPQPPFKVGAKLGKADNYFKIKHGTNPSQHDIDSITNLVNIADSTSFKIKETNKKQRALKKKIDEINFQQAKPELQQVSLNKKDIPREIHMGNYQINVFAYHKFVYAGSVVDAPLNRQTEFYYKALTPIFQQYGIAPFNTTYIGKSSLQKSWQTDAEQIIITSENSKFLLLKNTGSPARYELYVDKLPPIRAAKFIDWYQKISDGSAGKGQIARFNKYVKHMKG